MAKNVDEVNMMSNVLYCVSTDLRKPENLGI